MSVSKEYQIVNLMRVTLSIIFCLVILFLIMKFLWDSEVDSVTRFSAFFTAISSLGILATIGVYFWQRNDSIKKQTILDKKLMPFILSKSEKILSMICSVRMDIKKIASYSFVEIKNEKLVFYFPHGTHGNIIEKINLTWNDDTKFIDNNRLQVSYDVYIFILEMESCHSSVINEIKYFLNNWNFYGQYMQETSGDGLSKDELLFSLDSALEQYEKHIIDRRKKILLF